MAVIAANTAGLNPQPGLEPIVRRVLLQVLHELVTCHPSTEVTWNPVARKMRQRANGVQVQTVISAAPWLPHPPPLDDGGGDAAPRSVAAAERPAGPAPTMTTSSTRKGYC
jgi:hypothetical protein